MNLEQKYKEEYLLLAGLRQFVENGTMLSSVHFWRDSMSGYREFDILSNEGRKKLLELRQDFQTNDFLNSFILEEFPEIEGQLPENIIHLAFNLIEQMEGLETVELTKEFLLNYSIAIAKASKENWLAFVGLSDSISEAERLFIEKLKKLFLLNS